MSNINQPVYPSPESLTYHGVYDVDNILARQLLTLIQLQREAIHDVVLFEMPLVVILSPLKEGFQFETLVLRHVQVFDLLGLDSMPLT
jgi:hypothetical protein